MKKTISKRVSGFTLLEMMIVIAIVAILSAVMVPAIVGYSSRSKLNTQNSNAKVLFNSIQTIMQEYEFLDRNEHTTSDLYGAAPKEGTLFIRVTNDGNNATVANFQNVRKDGGSVPSLDPAQGSGGDHFHGVNLRAAQTSGANATFIARLGRLFPDLQEVSFSAMIRDYSVMGVLSAENKTSYYIGGYPLRTVKRTTLQTPSASCNAGSIVAADRTEMMRYCQDAWNNPTPNVFAGYA